ncbi:MAG: sugar ABC transporter substrate-binding protein [Planctomycetaceae bacterium]|nr:MAG: sugar ABC transporter substrate-binding protein [Planctomycetaceae bacterium]
MKKRTLFVIVLIAALALPALSMATAQEVVTIEFWDNRQAESGLSQYQQAAVDLFEETHPNIKVNVVTIPYTEYQDRLVIAVRGGTPPDVSTVDQIWNYGFATGGAIIPLDDMIAGSETVKEENFFPGAWASAAFEDQVWGVPFNIDVWQFTFYNKALLDAAGVDPQSLVTWEGLKAAGEALTDTENGKYGIGLFAHLGEDTVVVMNSFVYSNGGSVLAEDGSCALDEPGAIEALEYLASLLPYAPEGAANNASENMRQLFLNSSLATEWWPALEQPSLLSSDLDWDFVNGTAPEGKTPVGTLGGWNLVIYEQSQHKEEAWQFIEFMTSPEINGQVVDLVPANIEAANVFLTENRKGPELILEHLNNARPRPLSPEYLQVSTIQQEMMQAIVTGTSVPDAVAAACEQIDALAAE